MRVQLAVSCAMTSLPSCSGSAHRRHVATAAWSCSLPHCNSTKAKARLRVLTHGNGLLAWAGYLRFEGLPDYPPSARIVDAELRLHGSPACHGIHGENFTHQLHVLGSAKDPSALGKRCAWMGFGKRGTCKQGSHVALALVQQAADSDGASRGARRGQQRLVAQWGRQAVEGEFRLGLALHGRQLEAVRQSGRLSLAVTSRASRNNAGRRALGSWHKGWTCQYLSAVHSNASARPRLSLTFAWPCCGGGRGSSEGAAASVGAAEQVVARPPWMAVHDWASLPPAARLPLPWHSRLASEPPAWVYDAAPGATVEEERCAMPVTRAQASGGQLAPPPAGVDGSTPPPPAVSIVVCFRGNENLTVAAVRDAFACASEVPSAEYLLVDDGSDERPAALPALLRSLSATFGIRYSLTRYAAPVGFTVAVSEAARRATGTFLFILNNDAGVRRHALRALYATFATHADVGMVGARLVSGTGETQEAGVIVWRDGRGSWFGAGEPDARGGGPGGGGPAEGRHHRTAYVRDADAVSAAAAMVPRELFVRCAMFDPHYAPGYYEDTDLALTLRARGHRVLFQPLAVVVHASPHATYREAAMEALSERNRRHFGQKWAETLHGHLPRCEDAAACSNLSKPLYLELAATRLYLRRLLWIDQTLPEPDRDSGSVRTLTLLRLLLAARVHVSFVAVTRSGGRAQHTRYGRGLRYLGVEVLPSLRELRTALDAAADPAGCALHGGLGDGGGGCAAPLLGAYDLIVVARRDTYAAAARLLGRHYPTTPMIFDTVDLHFARERGRAAFARAHAAVGTGQVSGGGNGNGSGVAATSAANASGSDDGWAARRDLELDAVAASAVTLVVSLEEREVLAAELRATARPSAQIAVVGNALVPEAPTETPFGARHGLIFVGNFNHLPNRDAVLFFAREVLPRALAASPRARDDASFVFHVVGANRVPARILALNRTEPGGRPSRVVVHGHVPSLRPLFTRMRLSVAPLRWGAGVKGKINSAHMLGVPVVCSSVAAKGMGLVHGTHRLAGVDAPLPACASTRKERRACG